MLIGKPADTASSEITPKTTYMNRRNFLTGAVIAGAAAATRFAFRGLTAPALTAYANAKIDGLQKSAFSTTEKETPYKDVTNYNNFYEFSTDKYEPADRAKNFQTRPWSVTIDGDVKKKQVLDVDTIIKMAAPEERRALGRIFTERTDQARRPSAQSKIHRVHHLVRSETNARPAYKRIELALRRRSSHG